MRHARVILCMAGDDGHSVNLTTGVDGRQLSIGIFVKQHLHWTPPLVLIIYSTLDRGIGPTINDGNVALGRGRGQGCCT